MKKKIVVLTGAGISAESGIKTFRDSDGLWEGHNVMDVATPEGWKKNPALVLDFYNKRRQELKTVKPNEAHLILADLENDFEVQIITQNVDNLHEKAGSTNILHLHGELTKVRSVANKNYILNWFEGLNLGDLAPVQAVQRVFCRPTATTQLVCKGGNAYFCARFCGDSLNAWADSTSKWIETCTLHYIITY